MMSNFFDSVPEFRAVQYASTDRQIKHLMKCLRVKDARIAELEAELLVERQEKDQQAIQVKQVITGLAALDKPPPLPGISRHHTLYHTERKPCRRKWWQFWRKR